MAIYLTSSYGKDYVADEGLIQSQYPLIRVLLAFFTLIFGLIIEYIVWIFFYRLWTQRKRSSIMTILFCVYFLSAFFHTIHYSDNICRPVNYFESKWIYRQYLFSTMEIKFIANFPIVIMGYISFTQLMKSMVSGESDKINKYCLYFSLYILGSLLTITHYLIEPAFSYHLIPNLTIGGELVTAFILLLVMVRIYYLNINDMFGGPEKDLAKLLSNNNYSDEEEITFNRVVIEKVGKRLD